MSPAEQRELGHRARVQARRDAIAALPAQVRKVAEQMDAARHRYETLRRKLRRELKQRGLPPLPRVGGEA